MCVGALCLSTGVTSATRFFAMRTILLRTARAEGCILAADGPDDSEEDYTTQNYSDQQNDGLLHIHTRVCL